MKPRNQRNGLPENFSTGLRRSAEWKFRSGILKNIPRTTDYILDITIWLKKKQVHESPADMDESFRYCNKGADIFIFGGRIRGSMYGVMAFLENELGCRWYTPGVSVIPKRKSLFLTGLIILKNQVSESEMISILKHSILSGQPGTE